MTRSPSMRPIKLVAVVIALSAAWWVAPISAEDTTPRVVVAVLEPSAQGGGSHRLAYSVSVGESRFSTGDEVLYGLAKTSGTHLAMVVREDVAIGAILTVASLA